MESRLRSKSVEGETEDDKLTEGGDQDMREKEEAIQRRTECEG